MARTLGIDPGIADTGWALLEPAAKQGEPVKLLESGLIQTSPRTPLPERLRELHAEVAALLQRLEPESVAIEEMFFLKRAETQRATLQARGVILLAVAQAKREIAEYNPAQVKVSLTGSGSAAKPQMQRMVQRLLGLADILKPDHIADAAAIGLCHLRQARMKRLVVLDRVGGRG